MVSTVYQRDRKASNFEYFSRAVAIRNEITRLMASERVCPKRYRLLIGVPTVNTARELVYFCNKADSFYPSNSFNVLERKRYLTLAVAACDQLTQDLECLNNLDVVKDKGCLERVSAMIGDEVAALKGFRKNVRLLGKQTVEDRISAMRGELERLHAL